MTNKRQTISPADKLSIVDFKEAWRYRELLLSLAVRDIKVKYAQTFIGFAWSILTPIISVVFLSFVFQRIAGIEIKKIPSILFVFSGHICWSYFSTLVSQASDSIINAQSIIQKVYFPKIILPLSKAMSSLLEFLITIVILASFYLYYRYVPSENIIYFPFVIFYTLFVGLSFGILISSLTIRYRDFRFIVPFILQLGFFLTPIAYPLSKVPQEYVALYSLNPMVGVIESARWSLFGIEPSMVAISSSIIVTSITMIIGLVYFSKVEKKIADIL